MKKMTIIIFIILFDFVLCSNYEIIENNNILFLKYSQSVLSDEIYEFKEKYKEILNESFQINGEKKYINEIKYGKNYIDKTKYDICKVEEEVEKCLFYMKGKRKYYSEKKFSKKAPILMMTYDKSGRNPDFLSTKDGIKVWFENNELQRYRKEIKDNDDKVLEAITYIFDKKGNLEMIEVSFPLSMGSENYYFDTDGNFIKKEMYYKYK